MNKIVICLAALVTLHCWMAPRTFAFQHGLVGDGQFHFGTLTVTPLGDGTSRVTVAGGAAFDQSIIGRQFVSSRIHKNPNTYPAEGDNYYPGVIACRYSRVIKRENASSVIVDFEYNGGNPRKPAPSVDVDGYFFTDNRDTLKQVIESRNRPELITLEDDKVYVLKGMPDATLHKPIHLKRSGMGTRKPILMLSIEDAFDVAENGNGRCPTYRAQFGGRNFFNLLPTNDRCIIEGIDICPTFYTVPSVQYGAAYHYFWVDRDSKSSQGRICRIIDSNMFAVREMMMAALGAERPGMTFDLPEVGYCMSGGTDDGNDLTAMSEYGLYDTSWQSSQVMNFKSQTRAGVLFKAVGSDPERPVQLRENLKIKQNEYHDIPIRFFIEDGHTIAEADSDVFNWYMVANQDWNAGTSNNYNTFNMVDVALAGETAPVSLRFHNNADFWELRGPNAAITAFKSGRQARLFDRLPQQGDTVGRWESGANTGVFRKVDGNTFDIWGWQFAVGDQLAADGVTHTIVKIEYKTQDKSQSRHYVHYWRVTLDGPPIATADASFTVLQSKHGALLDGQYRTSRVYLNRGAMGHCFYTDGGVNMHLENVHTHGYWRSSSAGSGVPPAMYMAAKVAYFKNVVNHGGGVGAQWVPPYMKHREKLQGSQYRLILDGGALTVFQTDNDTFTIETRNSPLPKGRWYSPVNGDNTGLSSAAERGDFDLVLADGDTFSIANLKNHHVKLRATGQCTLLIDGYTGMPSRFINEKIADRQLGLDIIGADATTRLTIRGNGGHAPIRNAIANVLKSPERLRVELTDWTRVGDYYNDIFLNLGY